MRVCACFSKKELVSFLFLLLLLSLLVYLSIGKRDKRCDKRDKRCDTFCRKGTKGAKTFKKGQKVRKLKAKKDILTPLSLFDIIEWVINLKRERNELLEKQCNWVYKANDLIQKSRYSLTHQQQKIILFLISKINPYATEFKNVTFTIQEFCKVCGIDYESGKHYTTIKEHIKSIADKSCWIINESGRNTLLRWIEKPYIDENSGTIEIKFDNDMKPFLLQLKENYTRYSLSDTLMFKSKYSIRLFELIESFRYHKLETFEKVIEIEELKSLLDCENYKQFKDFNTRALKPAIDEINRFTYLNISYEYVKERQKIIAIKFVMGIKDWDERLEMQQRRNDFFNTDY